MSEDKLKKFIRDHRDEFELTKPPTHLWESIDKKINSSVPQHPTTIRLMVFKIMKIAAGVCLLLLAGAGGATYLQQNQGEVVVIKDPKQRSEYAEATSYFANQIDNKLVEIKKYETSDSILNELNQIDQIAAELKLEMLKNPDQDQDILIKQMVRQYQQRLHTLNKIVDKLQESEHKKTNLTNQKNQPNDTLPL